MGDRHIWLLQVGMETIKDLVLVSSHGEKNGISPFLARILKKIKGRVRRLLPNKDKTDIKWYKYGVLVLVLVATEKATGTVARSVCATWRQGKITLHCYSEVQAVRIRKYCTLYL
jgi:hypothetical protein